MSNEGSDSQPLVHLFTDGACSGNPGPGGWAFILRHIASGKEMEESAGEHDTTNNRMELTAVIRGLQQLKQAAGHSSALPGEAMGEPSREPRQPAPR